MRLQKLRRRCGKKKKLVMVVRQESLVLKRDQSKTGSRFDCVSCAVWQCYLAFLQSVAAREKESVFCLLEFVLQVAQLPEPFVDSLLERAAEEDE